MFFALQKCHLPRVISSFNMMQKPATNIPASTTIANKIYGRNGFMCEEGAFQLFSTPTALGSAWNGMCLFVRRYKYDWISMLSEATFCHTRSLVHKS